MADSEAHFRKQRRPNRLALALGWGACILLVCALGWFLWSNFMADRNARVAQDVSPTPEAATPQIPAPNSAPVPQAQQNPNPNAPAPAPSGAGQGTLSIEISSLQVTSTPDNLGDAMASPNEQAMEMAHSPSNK